MLTKLKKKILKFSENYETLKKINEIAIIADKKIKKTNNPDFVGDLLSKTWELKKKLEKV